MKKIKIILTIAIAISTTVLFGQTEGGGASFGLRGGFDYQTFNGKDHNGDKLKMDMVPRFHAGIVANIPIATDFFFQPGLLYTSKGAKSSNQFLGMNMNADYNLAYVELPLSMLYKLMLGNGHLLLGFGPYVAYGIGGKAKFEIGSLSTTEDIVFSKEYTSANPADWKTFVPFDYGGNLFFGYELAGGLSFQLNTQLGMAKINSDNTAFPNNKSEFRNTGYGLSLGYTF